MPVGPFHSSPDRSFNTIASVMGLVMIGIGLAIHFLGQVGADEQ